MNWRKLFDRAIENWPAKVLSLAVAIILFVFHRITTLETRFFSAPVIIEQLDAMLPANPYPGMIRVSLRGEANSIYSILDDDIEIYVDMGQYTEPGTYHVPVQWRKKGTALGVEPLQVSVDPPEISFVLDHKISKFVPLTAAFRGQVESGYNLTSFSLNPSQVIIDGPAGIMGGISELYTDLIDLDGRRSDFTVTANIMRRNYMVVIRGSGVTEFTGVISQIVPVRNIPNIPIIISGLSEEFTGELEINVGSIHLEGDNLDAIHTLDPLDFLWVDCSEINEPGIYILPVRAGAAEDLSLRIDPAELAVTVIYAGDYEQ